MAIKIEDVDFSKCLFNPTKSSLLNDTKHIKEFNVELGYHMSKKMILTYIILMYDYQCSLWREVRDLTIRKGIAMQLAGAKFDKEGHFERHIELILEGRNQDINAMIIKYIALTNNPSWGQLCAAETLFYYDLARVQNGAFKDSMSVATSTEKLAKMIKSLTEEVLGGDGESEPILAAIYRESTKDLDLSPEKISDYIMANGGTGLPEEWNPYLKWKEKEGIAEKAYKPEKIKFLGSK